MRTLVVSFIIMTAVMTAIIAAVLAFFALVGKKLTAKSRYAVWSIVTVMLCLPLPLISLAADAVGVGSSRASSVISTVPSAIYDRADSEIAVYAEGTQHGADVTPYTPATSDHGTDVTPYVPGISEHGSDVTPYVPETDARPKTDAPETSGDVILPEPSVQSEESGTKLTYITAAVIVWAVGAALTLAVAGVRYASFMSSVGRMKKSGLAHPACDATAAVYASAAERLGIKKVPELLVTKAAISPVLCGFVRPAVLTPDIQLTDAQLTSVFSHELIHHKRHDLALKLLSVISTALFWFDPLVHIAAAKLASETELSCDEAVLEAAGDDSRVTYGEAILAVVKHCKRGKTPLTSSFHSSSKESTVKERIGRILSPEVKKHGKTVIIATLVMCLIAAAVIVLTEYTKPYMTDAEIAEAYTEYVRVTNIGEIVGIERDDDGRITEAKRYNRYISMYMEYEEYIYYRFSYSDDGVACEEYQGTAKDCDISFTSERGGAEAYEAYTDGRTAALHLSTDGFVRVLDDPLGGTVTTEYVRQKNSASMTVTSVSSDGKTYVEEYVFDAKGNMVQWTHDGGIGYCEYDENGRMTRETYYNSYGTVVSDMETRYGDDGRIIYKSDGSTVYEYEYYGDYVTETVTKNGELVLCAKTLGGPKNFVYTKDRVSAGIRERWYDGEGRVNRCVMTYTAGGVSDVWISYDENGNQIIEDHSPARDESEYPRFSQDISAWFIGLISYEYEKPDVPDGLREETEYYGNYGSTIDEYDVLYSYITPASEVTEHLPFGGMDEMFLSSPPYMSYAAHRYYDGETLVMEKIFGLYGRHKEIYYGSNASGAQVEDEFRYIGGMLAEISHTERYYDTVTKTASQRFAADGRKISADFSYDVPDDPRVRWYIGEAIYGTDGKRTRAELITMIHDGYKTVYSERYHSDGSMDTIECEYYDSGAVMSSSSRWYDKDGKLIEFTVTQYVYDEAEPNEQSEIADKNVTTVYKAK